jgi:FAD/FMN-containing dehydrogenase
VPVLAATVGAMTILDSSLDGFTGTVLRPGDDGFEEARRVWNFAIDRRPAFIARCRTTADVAAAVRFGVRHDLGMAVRGGGHSIPGHSTCEGGLVVDLSRMKAVAVDPAAQRATVQPGVLWRELDPVTQQQGLAVPGGEVSDTGVAGLTLGGGIGWLSRAFGLTCDSLVAAELVAADGSVVPVSRDREPELLWGLCGGGGNFGVVTRFGFRLHPVPVPMFAGFVMHPLQRATAALAAFLELAADAPDRLGLNAALVVAPPAPFVPEPVRGRPVAILAAGWIGDDAEGADLVRRLREAGEPVLDTFGRMPYTALQSMVDDALPAGVASYARSEWLRPLDSAGAEALLAAASEPTSPMSQVLVRVMGGAIARVPADATAFRFREAAAMLTVSAMWPDPADSGEQHRAWCRAQWEALRPWSAGGGYVNHLGDEGRTRVREAYGDETWQRLVALKRRWDPDNVFSRNQNIPPTG